MRWLRKYLRGREKTARVVIVVAVRPPVVRRGTRHTIDVIGRKADMRGPARFTSAYVPSAALRLSPRTSRREHVARDAAQLSMGAYAPNGRRRAIGGYALSADDPFGQAIRVRDSDGRATSRSIARTNAPRRRVGPQSRKRGNRADGRA